MIRKKDCTLLGTLVKTHGTKGSILLLFRDLNIEDIKGKESVFVEIDGLLVPFFIEEFHERTKDSANIKLRDIRTEIQAKEFIGYDVYIAKSQVRRKKRETTGIQGIAGYRVEDQNLGFIGIAESIADIANNPLLRVQHEGRVYLIPVHQDIIIEIDDKEKVIVVEAPEGLFEL